MSTKPEFAKFMALLTKAIPRYAPTLDDALLEAWYHVLGQLDSAELNACYQRAVRQFDAFPSMRELLAIAGKSECGPEEQGREVAERIWATLCSGRGSSPNRDIQRQNDDYVGPIGAAVVRMAGGWHRLAESTKTSEETARKAQWREFAAIIAEKGGLGEAPQFDKLPSAPERPALGPGEAQAMPAEKRRELETKLKLLKIQRLEPETP